MSKRMEIVKGALMLAGILFVVTNFPIVIVFGIVFLLLKALSR